MKKPVQSEKGQKIASMKLRIAALRKRKEKRAKERKAKNQQTEVGTLLGQTIEGIQAKERNNKNLVAAIAEMEKVCAAAKVIQQQRFDGETSDNIPSASRMKKEVSDATTDNRKPKLPRSKQKSKKPGSSEKKGKIASIKARIA